MNAFAISLSVKMPLKYEFLHFERKYQMEFGASLMLLMSVSVCMCIMMKVGCMCI